MLLALPIQDLEIHLQLQLVDTMLIKLPLGKTCPKKLGQVHSKRYQIRSLILLFYFSFSRRTTIGQIEEFLCQKFSTKLEDMRLWHFKGKKHASKI